MHMVIRAIVCAQNEEEAFDIAEEVFDRLVQEGCFDYWTRFDEDEPMEGKQRGRDLPVAIKAGSEEGKKLIEEGMAFTNQVFREAVASIREMLAKNSDDQLVDEPRFAHASFRWECHRIGMYSGSSVWLYDGDGIGIRSEGDLKAALKAPKGMTVFVVPADVHC